jgi:hypothetical protein
LIEHERRNLHDSERMLEPIVAGGWIYHLRKRELPDSPQSLKDLVINYFLLPRGQLDEAVDRISDDFVGVSHATRYASGRNGPAYARLAPNKTLAKCSGRH